MHSIWFRPERDKPHVHTHKIFHFVLSGSAAYRVGKKCREEARPRCPVCPANLDSLKGGVCVPSRRSYPLPQSKACLDVCGRDEGMYALSYARVLCAIRSCAAPVCGSKISTPRADSASAPVSFRFFCLSAGMRNLTARRCQHEGCFTVANFGFPGDKPGFCAAHSTDGVFWCTSNCLPNSNSLARSYTTAWRGRTHVLLCTCCALSGGLSCCGCKRTESRASAPTQSLSRNAFPTNRVCFIMYTCTRSGRLRDSAWLKASPRQ